MRSCLAIVLVAGVAAGWGCSSDRRVTSTGTVSFDGRPVETGTIVFVPFDRAVPPEGATIAAGRFAVAGRPGRHRVQIRGTRIMDESRVPATMPRMAGVPVREDYIPAAYNAESTLEVEVTPGGPNVFDFDLKSRP